MELRYTGNKTPIRSFKVPHSRVTVPYSEVLTDCFQFMGGRVSSVEEILSRQPDLRVLRDPPSLVGQRIRYVLLFHLDPEDSEVTRCKLRAYAWTDPSLCLKLQLMNPMVSTMLAQTVFDEAKKDFEERDPNEIRSRGRNPSLPVLF